MNNSSDPKDIAGWLSCSIIRHKTNSKQTADDYGLQAFDWNIVTAENMNALHGKGLDTQHHKDSSASTQQPNSLIEVLKTGCRRAQNGEFPEEDFIVITNLAIHPNCPTGQDLSMQLLLEARMQACKLGMPVYVFAAGEDCTWLYKEKCGFTEIGQHLSWSIKPEYTWKHFVFRPGEWWASNVGEVTRRFDSE